MSHPVPQIQAIERSQLRDVPHFQVGDTVKVHYRIREGDKERIQVFQGVVLRRRGSGINETFTVRKVSFGVGVERIFPLHSPRVEKIEVAFKGLVRRARLYFLRERRGKKARVREKAWWLDKIREEEEAAAAEAAEAEEAAEGEEADEGGEDAAEDGPAGEAGAETAGAEASGADAPEAEEEERA